MKKRYTYLAAAVAGLWCATAVAQTTSDPSAGTGSGPATGSSMSGSSGNDARSSSGPMGRLFGGMRSGSNAPNLNSSFSGGSGSQIVPRTTGGSAPGYRPGTGSVMTEANTTLGTMPSGTSGTAR